MRVVIFISIAVLFVVGCSDKNPAMPETEQTYSLSGQVLNQFGEPAPELIVVVSDTQSRVDSAVTDSAGTFRFAGLHKGLVGIRFVPTTAVVAYLPRYLFAETVIDLQGDTLRTFYVREFNEIYHDDGTRPGDWIFHGGVSHVDSSYVFTDQPGQSDSMIMSSPVQLPVIDGPVLFLIEGAAVPSDSGLIRVRVISDDEYVGTPHNLVFVTDTTFRNDFAAELANRPGSMVRLDLAMQTVFDIIQYPASEIHLTDIWIFSY